jgi:hypothetical protein
MELSTANIPLKPSTVTIRVSQTWARPNAQSSPRRSPPEAGRCGTNLAMATILRTPTMTRP